MTLILNGTNGLSDVDGSAATPAVRGTDANTGIFFPAADTIAFAEGGAEVMRLNSDAQVVVTAGTVSLPAITTTGDLNTGIFFPAADTVAFAEGGAESMRIDSSGNLLLGATAQIQSEKLGVTSGTANATQYQTISTKGGSTLFVNQQQTTSVSTSATTILNGPQYLNFCLVYGTDGTNRFADVVLMSVGTGTVNVMSSLGAAGSPAARTYTQSSSSLRLAMASGTYTVQVTCLAMGT
jgi:hypothetical protein